MEENEIRQEVRVVLREMMQQMHPAYPINGGDNMFPHGGLDDIVRLPEDINTKEDYLINWEGMSTNNDLYGFPMEEFKKGIQVEKAKNDMFNILDISKIVINNLKDNPQFYTNLGVE
jgi:hypothetical protein